MPDIIKKIYDAKIQKGKLEIKKSRMIRRALKLSEESGEVSEAVLGVTGKEEENYKNKSYDDVREELVDSIIVAVDFLYSTFPDEKDDLSFEDVSKLREDIFNKKIDKWLAKKERKPK